MNQMLSHFKSMKLLYSLLHYLMFIRIVYIYILKNNSHEKIGRVCHHHAFTLSNEIDFNCGNTKFTEIGDFGKIGSFYESAQWCWMKLISYCHDDDDCLYLKSYDFGKFIKISNYLLFLDCCCVCLIIRYDLWKIYNKNIKTQSSKYYGLSRLVVKITRNMNI